MPSNDDLSRLVERLGSAGSVVEEELAWDQLRPFGARVLPYFLDAYSRTRNWQGRASLVFHAIQFARSDPLAAKLAVSALSDKSRMVRYRACMLLACSLERSALPALRQLLSHSDASTVEDARAAIDAIERRNHHVFIDRSHSGGVRLNFDGQPLHEYDVSQSNPYEPTRVPLADAVMQMAKRPRVVTIALSLFWIVLALTALASVTQLRTLPSVAGSIAYVSYLVALAVVPAFLLLNIAWGHSWARIALLIFESLNVVFRIYLVLIEGQFTTPIAVGILVPTQFKLIAFVLLFLPQSNRWFAARQGT